MVPPPRGDLQVPTLWLHPQLRQMGTCESPGQAQNLVPLLEISMQHLFSQNLRKPHFSSPQKSFFKGQKKRFVIYTSCNQKF